MYDSIYLFSSYPRYWLIMLCSYQCDSKDSFANVNMPYVHQYVSQRKHVNDCDITSLQIVIAALGGSLQVDTGKKRIWRSDGTSEPYDPQKKVRKTWVYAAVALGPGGSESSHICRHCGFIFVSQSMSIWKKVCVFLSNIYYGCYCNSYI